MSDSMPRSGISAWIARAALLAAGAVAGLLAGRSLDERQEPDEPGLRGAQSPRPRSRSRSSSPSADAPRAKPPAPDEEPPPVEEPAPTGLRSEHDIERILRSHLKRDPPMERVREVVVLRQALFDAQRRAPQDWEDEALRRVIRSVKGEVPPLPKQAATDAAQLLKVARDLGEPFVWTVTDGPHFATLFQPASDGERMDVTKLAGTVRAEQPVVFLFPEGVHEWDERLVVTGKFGSDLTFQGAGMDATLLQPTGRLFGKRGGLTVLRDLTLFLGDALDAVEGHRLRLERCRVVGWEERGSSLFQNFRGLVLASDCRFEGGYRAKGAAALLYTSQDQVLARFERCRFRGPLDVVRGWDAESMAAGTKSPLRSGSTWLFESCTFLQMTWPTADHVALPRDDGLRLVSCLADSVGASPDDRRSLADINPAWHVVR